MGVSSPDALNCEQLDDLDDNHRIDINVTLESKLTPKEVCSNKGTQKLQHAENASNKAFLSENQKCSNGDIDLESNHDLHSIANQFSLVSRVLPFTVKDVIKSGEPHCEDINMAREDQLATDLDVEGDILTLVNGVHQYEGKPLANESNSDDQDGQLKSELPNIYQMETTVPTVSIVSQQAAIALKESSSKELAKLALQEPAEDTNEMSPVLQDIPLVFQEVHSIAITATKSSELTENKENVFSIGGTHCISSIESVVKREVTEITETRLIGSSSSCSGKPSATSLSSVNTHIMVKTHPDGGWGWVVCLGAFLVQFIVLGMQNTAGIVYTELVKELKSPRGATGDILRYNMDTTYSWRNQPVFRPGFLFLFVCSFLLYLQLHISDQPIVLKKLTLMDISQGSFLRRYHRSQGSKTCSGLNFQTLISLLQNFHDQSPLHKLIINAYVNFITQRHVNNDSFCNKLFFPFFHFFFNFQHISMGRLPRYWHYVLSGSTHHLPVRTTWLQNRHHLWRDHMYIRAAIIINGY